MVTPAQVRDALLGFGEVMALLCAESGGSMTALSVHADIDDSIPFVNVVGFRNDESVLSCSRWLDEEGDEDR